MQYFKITDGPKESKTSELMDTMRSRFNVWSYYDNDTLDKDFPVPEKETTRYFAKTCEADEDMAGKSAEQIEKEGIPTCTLRERLMMEIQYFDETGENLDKNNITLCAASRYGAGCVPSVDRGGGGSVRVGGWDVRGSGSGFRVRRAVSPSSLPLDISLESAIAQVKAAGYKVIKEI